MSDSFRKYGLLAVKVLAGVAFLAAGLAKLAGAEMMVETFDAVGVGQWFRYATGIIEVAGAVLLFVPGRQAFGAALLALTMVGASVAHVLVLGVSTMPPAVILLILSLIVLCVHREQLSAS